MQDQGDPGEVDLQPWGKSRGLGEGNFYPLVCHLLDAGAAARRLWDTYVPAGVKALIADGFGVTVERAGALVALWAALHDIGKLIPEFQAVDRTADLSAYPPSRGHRIEHEQASQDWLQWALPRCGYELDADDRETPGFLIPQLLGGHHGIFRRGAAVRGPITLASRGFRDDAWEQQRKATLAMVQRILDAPEPPPRATVPAAALACAIIVLADWLVSQETHLVPRLDDLPASGTETELRQHFRKSLRISDTLIENAGLIQQRLKPGSFAESFPHINPNGLQQSLADRLPGLAHGPGLLLVTAPPGLGKTETGLYAAKVMGEATGHPGVYTALPTTATADQIYKRIYDYLDGQAEVASSLMLLHGMAWLNPKYWPETEPAQVLTGDGHQGDPFAAADWLLGRWRGMCGSWAVGTIDQALMAVLKSRYNALRLFGLAGKTVIIDEVHACDPYMQGLLLRLLRWLGTFGTPVVLLSATLTGRAAGKLVSAYLEGAHSPPRKNDSAERIVASLYPGWLYADAGTGEITTAAVTLPPTPNLRISVREISAVTAPNGGTPAADRGPALRAELAPLAESGGCALVICTTVTEAQDTFCQLREWFTELAASGGTPPDLELLHARFPAWQREQISNRVMTRYGKNEDRERPRAAVLVATSIVEQSLDLDFDLIISDLAPIALLLQRAGRCWRHERLRKITRPPWSAEPRLTVLVPPGGPKSPQLFGSWKAIYDASLLANTYQLLTDRSVIRIPGEVQQLIDDVYDDALFTDGDLSQAALERIGEEIALTQLSGNIAIPAPADTDDLALLTDLVVPDPEMLATRFDADSVRALPVFVGPDGEECLDRECEIPLPGMQGTPDLTVCRKIIQHTVPVRGGLWLNKKEARAALPRPWQRNVHLRDLVLLRQHSDANGSFAPAVIEDREFYLDEILGLRTSRIR
ncbi:MAG: CRISPR-associated endonuclease Cas3'' [Nocardiopsaceae bacterium]|nr:CRISPR-associated endonuclease Cas3'' [Nocardiopsaceae bacterium]